MAKFEKHVFICVNRREDGDARGCCAARGGEDVAAATEALLDVLAGMHVDVTLVANEVGLGIVPDNALARRFRDEAGRLNMRLARSAGRVVFMIAGMPLMMKGTTGS